MAKNPFDPDYAPYGTYEGEPGNPDQWKAAFEAKMNADEAKGYLGSDPYLMAVKLLQIPANKPLTAELVRRQYRKLAMKAHPDQGGSEEKFKELHAAYSLLLEDA